MDLAQVWPYLRDVVALGGGAFAVVSYHRAQKQRRAEWLDGLYTRFYEQGQYKRIRRILDYGTEPDLGDLRTAIEQGAPSDAAEQLVDYLNFFEFLGSLRDMGQLSEKEISMLFEYYVSRLNDHQFVVTFVDTQGFERLSAMMKARRLPKAS
jgi:hypothetical protein